MKHLLWILLLAGCSHTSESGHSALDGTWILKGAHCVTGSLGPVGRSIVLMIASKMDEEIYEVNGRSVLWRVRERKPQGDGSAYCETIFSANWDVDSSQIHTSGAVFKSREGVHGYKCYEPFRQDQAPEASVQDYELKGNTLLIHRPEPAVNAKDETPHTCQNGSDLVYDLVRE